MPEVETDVVDKPARDRSYGRTLLVGIAGAGLLAVAGHRDWLTLDTAPAQEAAASVFLDASPGLAQQPAAGAMGLVALAAWGVLLVVRGVWRRVMAVLAVLAGVGALAAWATAWGSLADGVEERAADYGLAGAFDLGWTPWFWVGAVGAVLTLLAGVVAVRRVGGWPTMGSRYDAPTGAGAAAAAAVPQQRDLAEADPTELWKSLDEGHDPT